MQIAPENIQNKRRGSVQLIYLYNYLIYSKILVEDWKLSWKRPPASAAGAQFANSTFEWNSWNSVFLVFPLNIISFKVLASRSSVTADPMAMSAKCLASAILKRPLFIWSTCRCMSKWSLNKSLLEKKCTENEASSCLQAKLDMVAFHPIRRKVGGLDEDDQAQWGKKWR